MYNKSKNYLYPCWNS